MVKDLSEKHTGIRVWQHKGEWRLSRNPCGGDCCAHHREHFVLGR